MRVGEDDYQGKVTDTHGHGAFDLAVHRHGLAGADDQQVTGGDVAQGTR